MFYKFNQHKESHQPNEPSATDQLANRMADEGLKMQRSIANRLNAFFRKLPNWLQRFLIYGTLMAAAIASGLLISNSWLPSNQLENPSEFAPGVSLDFQENHNELMELYLDSLDAATIQDSIDQSQTSHADENTDALP